MVSFGWGYFLADLQKAMSLTVAPDAEAIFLAGYQELRPLPPALTNTTSCLPRRGKSPCIGAEEGTALSGYGEDA